MRGTSDMRELLIIGIGPGHPDQITVQAVRARTRVDVLFRFDKGDAKSGLYEVRDEILQRHAARPGWSARSPGGPRSGWT
jgi:precorrin-6A synthase